MACWFSIMALLRDHSPCYLWTVTHPERDAIPDSWFSRAHGNFLRNVDHAAKQHYFRKDWGGVRVYEPHPSGHGLHSHLVLKGYMEWYKMAECAKHAGLGRINVHPDPCGQGTAAYLAKYLTKSVKPIGVRAWACVGDYRGEYCKDITFESERITHVKRLAAEYRRQGFSNYLAFRMALQQVSNPGKPWTEEELTPF